MRKITLEQYRKKKPFQRILARTQISLATVESEGAGEASALRIGGGFQSQLLDKQDWRKDKASSDCINVAWKTHRQPAYDAAVLVIAREDAQAGYDLSKDERNAIRARELKQATLAPFEAARISCRKQAAKRALTRASWMIGSGIALRSEESETSDIEFDGASFWSTYRHPIGSTGNCAIVAFVKGDLNQTFTLDEGMVSKGDGVLGAVSAALEYSDWKADITASHTYRNYSDPMIEIDFSQRYSATFGYKVRDGVWLEASAGVVSNSSFDEDGFATIQVKFDMSDN